MSDEQKHCLYFGCGHCRMKHDCRWKRRDDKTKCQVDGVLYKDILDTAPARHYLVQNAFKGGQFD